jgi:hypothetical protein
MDEMGPFYGSIYADKFGSWNNALREIGLDPSLRRDVPLEELISEVKRLSDSLDRTPTQDDVTELGKFSLSIYHRRFDSWDNAVQRAGFEPYSPKQFTDEDLLDELDRMVEKLGRPPTEKEVKELSRRSLAVYYSRFGGLNNALLEAGYKTYWDRYEPVNRSQASYRGTWKRQRRKRRELDEYQCISCEMTDAQHKSTYNCELGVHHVVRVEAFRDENGNLDEERAHDVRNLRTFCHPCHNEWEGLPVMPDTR